MKSRRALPAAVPASAERERQRADAAREANWTRFGPYLSERQWGTVREDYSEGGSCWDYFPHDHARSRAYRWGEDGLLGVADRQCRMCFAVALWNERDPILKERLFGLTGPQGNHGEDVKEHYFYLDSTPTHSYMRALYKYPQTAFPYAELEAESARRGRAEPEFELADAGAFDGERYFDVFAEYAKAAPEDLFVRVRVVNRGPDAARLHVLPQLWFRNTWSFGGDEAAAGRPRLELGAGNSIRAEHPALGRYLFEWREAGDRPTEALFTENDTNVARLYGAANPTAFVKDAFHEAVVRGAAGAVNPAGSGTKCAVHFVATIPAGGEVVFELRLAAAAEHAERTLAGDAESVFARRRAEADEFHRALAPQGATEDELGILRQGAAGLLWSKQFFHYVVEDWLAGDPGQPAPPAQRKGGRNAEWGHFHARDVLSMPDKWEYPWFATWDLAFHMIPFAELDLEFAKRQLLLLLREWYMHPNGQMPAYEFAFGDVNPPVHAWAAWRIYKKSGPRGQRDRKFLNRVFQKLLINFTWWVNRKDVHGRHVFAGGFLGLDNIGLFDRSQPLPAGGHLEQADGTAWMAFYAGTMLSMALELAEEDPAAEDLASKFFEHYVAIIDAINTLDGSGLYDERDGFYYDHLHWDGRSEPLRVRSLVGLVPLIAVELLEVDTIQRLPEFARRMQWFLDHKPGLARHVVRGQNGAHDHVLLAVPPRERLERILRCVLDETEFLSPYGIRSVSQAHRERPCTFAAGGREYRVDYAPGESETGLFGGNSNWRGPVWFPLNFLLIEALERYHHFYGDQLRVECPVGSGRMLNLSEVAGELGARLVRLFRKGPDGARPCHGGDPRFAREPAWRDLVLFHEYFHGDTGRGLGASHQTGWTALAVPLLADEIRRREIGGAARDPWPAQSPRKTAGSTV